jgi:hypothetical protein
MTLTGDGLRSNEIATLLAGQFDDANSRPGAWRWLRENWAALAPRLPTRNAARMPALVKGFCDEAMAGQVATLFADSAQRYAGGQRALDKATETIVNCARRTARERDAVRAAFAPGVRR